MGRTFSYGTLFGLMGGHEKRKEMPEVILNQPESSDEIDSKGILFVTDDRQALIQAEKNGVRRGVLWQKQPRRPRGLQTLSQMQEIGLKGT